MSAGDFSDKRQTNAAGQRAHTRLVREIISALGSEPDLALHVNPVGEAELGSLDSDGVYRQRHAVVGLGPGSPDIVGWLTSSCGLAVVFCIEVKTGSGVLNENQKPWHEEHLKRGVLVSVARSVEDARRSLARARQVVAERMASGTGRRVA